MWVPTDPRSLPPSLPPLDSTRLDLALTSCAHMSECGCIFLSHTPPQFFFQKNWGFFLLEKLVPINTSGWVFFPDNSRTETGPQTPFAWSKLYNNNNPPNQY